MACQCTILRTNYSHNYSDNYSDNSVSSSSRVCTAW